MSENAAAPPKGGFDLTVNLGHILVLCGMVVGLVGSHYVNDYRLASVEQKVTSIERKLDNFSTLVIDGAVTAQRLREFERRIEMVERR